eukprot:scaffold199535_cov26-Tisochrysis_lutea.AAC.6
MMYRCRGSRAAEDRTKGGGGRQAATAESRSARSSAIHRAVSVRYPDGKMPKGERGIREE